MMKKLGMSLLVLVSAYLFFEVMSVPTGLLIDTVEANKAAGQDYTLIQGVSQVMVNLFLLVVSVLGARFFGLLSWPKTPLDKSLLWKVLLLGEVAIMVAGMIGSVLIQLQGGGTTANQAAVLEYFSQSAVWVQFVMIVIYAPIMEEFLTRSLVPKIFPPRLAWFGYALGGFLFAFLHGPSDLGSWIVYGGMSLSLTAVAYISKRVEYSILLHMLHNFIGFIIILISLAVQS